jgi:hypothetical protein
MKNQKITVINWFRYEHYYNEQSSDTFIKGIEYLEKECNTQLCESTGDEAWKKILSSLNLLNDEQIQHLSEICLK